MTTTSSQAVSSEPTPEFAAMVAEEHRWLLSTAWTTMSFAWVAILAWKGFTTDAIADQLCCARRTVARQLALLIRRILDTDSD